MLEFKCTSNFDEIEKNLQKLYKEQIPYVTAVSLTRLAQLGFYAIQNSLKKTFHIRNQFLEKSIFITTAKKTDYPDCFSAIWVSDRAKFLQLQIEGGEREAKKSIDLGKRLGVRSTLGVPFGVRENPDMALTKALWVSTLIKKHGYVALMSDHGRELLLKQKRVASRKNEKHVLIKRRKRRIHTGNSGWKRDTVYELHRGYHVPERWDFNKIATDAFNDNFREVFTNELGIAIDRSNWKR